MQARDTLLKDENDVIVRSRRDFDHRLRDRRRGCCDNLLRCDGGAEHSRPRRRSTHGWSVRRRGLPSSSDRTAPDVTPLPRSCFVTGPCGGREAIRCDRRRSGRGHKRGTRLLDLHWLPLLLHLLLLRPLLLLLLLLLLLSLLLLLHLLTALHAHLLLLLLLLLLLSPLLLLLLLLLHLLLRPLLLLMRTLLLLSRLLRLLLRLLRCQLLAIRGLRWLLRLLLLLMRTLLLLHVRWRCCTTKHRSRNRRI